MRGLWPFLAAAGAFACEVEEDDLRGSGVLNLLQTQARLTLNGQAIDPSPMVSQESISYLAKVASHQDPQIAENMESTISQGIPYVPLAACIFGISTIFVLGVYLVKITSRVTQASAWSVINKMLAAFIAALLVACIRDVTNYCMPDNINMEQFLLSPLCRLAAMFLIVKVLLHYCKQEDSLIAISTLGSFVIGLTAIDLFDGILALDGTEEFGINFAQSPGSVWVGSMCCVGMMLFAMWLLTLQRNKSANSMEQSMSHYYGTWIEQSEDTDDDAFAIVTGFLMCQVALFAAEAKEYPTAKMPLILADESPIPYKTFGVVTLLYALWLAIASNIWTFKRLRVTHQFVRIEYLLVRTASMVFAWCVLRWGELVFWSSQQRWLGHLDPMCARLGAAFTFIVGSFIFVFFVTSLLKDSKDDSTPDFYAPSSSLGLLVGQSWMSCFYRASAGFSVPAVESEIGEIFHAQLGHTRGNYSYIQLALILTLLLALLLLWRTRIVPHTPKKETSIRASAMTSTPAIDALLASMAR